MLPIPWLPLSIHSQNRNVSAIHRYAELRSTDIPKPHRLLMTGFCLAENAWTRLSEEMFADILVRSTPKKRSFLLCINIIFRIKASNKIIFYFEISFTGFRLVKKFCFCYVRIKQKARSLQMFFSQPSLGVAALSR